MFNTKKIIKNAFRISKVRGETAIRLRIPGGHLEAKYLDVIKYLAERFGNATVHLTTRQGYEIPGVKISDIDKVKVFMADMICQIEKDSNVILDEPDKGYPSAGTRNVSACIGNRVCQFSNSDTTLLAQKIEEVIYPNPSTSLGISPEQSRRANDYHLKIGVCGCPNDCIKAHMNDIGIIANVVPEYDKERCIMCEACMDNCRQNVTNALSVEDHHISRDKEYCLECGECILKCPMAAFTRGKQFYRIIIGGRTGKRNPRLANTFIKDANQEVVLAVCKNIYSFIHRYIDTKLPKEHLGYIIDRAGFDSFVQEVTAGVKMNPEVKVVRLDNPGYFYPIRNL